MLVGLYGYRLGRPEALRAVLSFLVPLIGLAIIVLFQSELRRTLARLGESAGWDSAPGTALLSR